MNEHKIPLPQTNDVTYEYRILSGSMEQIEKQLNELAKDKWQPVSFNIKDTLLVKRERDDR